jgi:hypothetical protein
VVSVSNHEQNRSSFDTLRTSGMYGSAERSTPEGAMEEPKKRAANCKWAHPTLSEPHPVWFETEDRPWTCERDEDPRALESTEVCEDCPRWEHSAVKSPDGARRPS